MNPNKRPLTNEELWKALYESDSSDNEENPLDEGESEDEDSLLPDDHLEDEFDVRELQEEVDAENNIEIDPNAMDQDVEKDDRPKILGKNNYVWFKQPMISRRTRTSKKNIVLHLPGPKGEAKNKTSVKELWQLFFPDSLIEIILTNTNKEIEVRAARFNREQYYVQKTNRSELLALIGLLYFAGVLKNAHLSLADMWSEKFGASIFRCTMPKNRFDFLLTCLRFDDKTTRPERKALDKFAAIRDIWDIFIQGCQDNYTPSEYLTIDEQLLSFRGRCPFKMYIPSKPDKYGLKVVMMCDAKTSYMCTALPYIGKEQRDKQKGSIPTQYVLKLTENIQGTNRNITMDNWFSSCELAEKLLEKGLTMVGTLRKNKKEVPPQYLMSKRSQIPSSAFAFSQNITLVSHVPKKNKCVLLISSMHSQDEVDEETGKPEIILFYNSTKGGVDTFDQLCHSKTVARKTRRWPLRFFYGMLDGAGVNTMVLYRLKHSHTKVSRSTFIKSLADSLVEDHMKERMSNLRLPKKLRQSIRDYLGYPDEQPVVNVQRGTRRCDFCPRRRDRKGRHVCVHCAKNMCAEHQFSICEDCKS